MAEFVSTIRNRLKYIDKTYWVLFLLLIGVAMVCLASASSTLAFKSESGLFNPFLRQVMMIVIGVVAAFIVQLLPSIWIRRAGYFIWFISLFCLFIISAHIRPFAVYMNGAWRWFNLFGFQFQPSELAKFSLLIVVADQLISPGHWREKLLNNDESAFAPSESGDLRKPFFTTLIMTIVTVLPIMLGNLSTALLLFAVVFLVWFLARVPFKYLGSIVAIGLLTLVLGYLFVEYAFVKPGRVMNGPFSRAVTWAGRIDDMFAEHQQDNSTFVVNDDNYQRSMAQVAVARGGASPFGVLPGNSLERNFLPQAFADYIFAIFVEENGIVGAFLLMALYFFVLFRSCYVSAKYIDYSSMLMMLGLALMITMQALVSMMVSVGIGPVTGQPLPMISRGGTSVIITALYFGVMMAVSREQQEEKAKTESVKQESFNITPDLPY